MPPDPLPDALLPIRRELLDEAMVARVIDELKSLLRTTQNENGHTSPYPTR